MDIIGMKSKRKLKKRIMKRRIAGLLVAAQLLTLLTGITGCGKEEVEVPELLNPVSQVMCYRPVTKRFVGKAKMYYGVVVPMEYPCFAAETVDIAEVLVGVGDYVEEGDVIAYGYMKELNEQIEADQTTINSLSSNRAFTQEVSEKTQERIEYEKHIEEYLGDSEGVDAKEKEIAIEQENLRYNLAVIDTDISINRSDISKINEKTSKLVFTAPHSGYVTFVKDFSTTNHVDSNENIAVIADYDDLYIETSDVNTEKYEYEDYKYKYTVVDGKQYNLKEKYYTNDELSYAISVKRNPPMAFDAPGANLKLGNNVALYFIEKAKENVIAVGNDSIFTESGDSYVYVLPGGAEAAKALSGASPSDGASSGSVTETLERRSVELGINDGLYTEIISGVQEGEMVFYKNTLTLPLKYEEFTVELGNYIEECSSNMVLEARTYYDIYISDISGSYVRLHESGPSSPGDALFSIKSDKGDAVTESARIDIANLDTDRDKEIKDENEQKEELKTTIHGADIYGPGDISTESDAVREHMYLAERTQCDLDILGLQIENSEKVYNSERSQKVAEYNKVLKGTRSIGDHSDYVEYIEHAGLIEQSKLTTGDKIQRGTYINTVKYADKSLEKTRLFVINSEGVTLSKVVYPGKTGINVTVKNKNQSWTGKCIGINGDNSRFTLFTRNGKQYSTLSKPFDKQTPYQFYIELDTKLTEEEVNSIVAMGEGEVKYTAIEMDGVVTIPTIAVNKEYDDFTSTTKYFVWKMESGILVKEYVVIYETDAANGQTYILSGVEPGDILIKS